MTVTQPGRICAHTHLYSGLVPLGMPAPEPPPETFVQILERVWWRLDRALTPEILRASARLYVAEALLAGTTGLVDHHESPSCIAGSLDVLADAVEALGARALLCYGATDRNGGPAEGAAGLAECARFVREPRERVRGLVGLHASFTVSDQTVRAAGALCRELGVPLHVHVAEDAADVADARARGHAGPLERLAALDALPAGSILAHGIHLTPAQVALAQGCWFVQNARSNEGNRVGYPTALQAADRVALGTDGYPADMVVERDAAIRLGAPHGEGPDVARGRLDAGRALLGAFFDLDGDRVALDERGAVRHVWVGGRAVVRDGVLVHADLDTIRAEARAAADDLWTRMEAT
jgi:cytosine/adenosine deaminase-related metal-dependent hydrolase